MINITNKMDCCGCSACYSVCPKKCINMDIDDEGFEYPKVNHNSCINCGLCTKVCPVLNCKDENQFIQKAFLAQHKSDEIRIDSTSGGAFTAIAQYVIKKGGVVFGVALNTKLHAYHTYVTEVEELVRFRNSKYMQSIIGKSFITAKDFLDEGRIVLFSGTACQIEGLKAYLRKDYVNLITVDVVCRAVPSPLIFDKYLEFQERVLGEKVENVRFRDKFYGYKYSTMNLKTKSNNGNYHHGIESDPWLRAFFSNICDRPSCHKCKFKKQYRVSDITIWDCFNVSRFSKLMDDDKGTTRVLTHTSKGNDIIRKLDFLCTIKEVEVKDIVEGVYELLNSTPSHPRRDEFFCDANKMSGVELYEKYFSNSIITKIKYCIRVILNSIGIYSFVKKIVWRVIKKG